MKPGHARILAAIKAHARAKSYGEIAALLGLSKAVVAGVGRKAGFRKPYVQEVRRAKLAHTRKVIIDHARTHTLRQIGRMLDVTGEAVRLLCKRWKIERRNFKIPGVRGMTSRELRELVHQPEKTLTSIAREAGITGESLRHELRRRGIKPFTKRERNAELLKRGLRVCSRCRRVKSLDPFTRDANCLSGFNNRCLQCTLAITREWMKRKAQSHSRS